MLVFRRREGDSFFGWTISSRAFQCSKNNRRPYKIHESVNCILWEQWNEGSVWPLAIFIYFTLKINHSIFGFIFGLFVCLFGRYNWLFTVDMTYIQTGVQFTITTSATDIRALLSLSQFVVSLRIKTEPFSVFIFYRSCAMDTRIRLLRMFILNKYMKIKLKYIKCVYKKINSVCIFFCLHQHPHLFLAALSNNYLHNRSSLCKISRHFHPNECDLYTTPSSTPFLNIRSRPDIQNKHNKPAHTHFINFISRLMSLR